MLQHNKKALSEVVGYVMLILIAVSLAILVYGFLKVYVPQEKPICKEDISLIVQDYYCNFTTGNLTLTLSNRGLFNVSGAYIRLGNESKKIKQQINRDNLNFINLDGSLGLVPAGTYTSIYRISEVVLEEGNYGLEILPFSYSGNKLVVCDKALISQTINCR